MSMVKVQSVAPVHFRIIRNEGGSNQDDGSRGMKSTLESGHEGQDSRIS